VISPLIRPSAGSTLSLWVNYSSRSGNFDRAVVRAVDPVTGIKTLLTATGAPYDTPATPTCSATIWGTSGLVGESRHLAAGELRSLSVRRASPSRSSCAIRPTARPWGARASGSISCR
jgi:hypothetical protein